MTILEKLASSASMRLLATCFVLGVHAPVSAQSGGPDEVFDAAGVQPGRDYFTQLDFERVDTLNGNVMLSFTDVSFPGPPGLEVAFQRHYNSKGGWSFGLAGVPMWIDGRVGDPLDPAAPPNTSIPVSDWLPRFHMADGAVEWSAWRYAYESESYPDGGCAPLNDTCKWRWVVTGRFWRFDRVLRVLHLPDGRVAEYDGLRRLVRVRTPFSHDGKYEIRIAYTPRGDGLTDDVITQHLGDDEVRTITAIGGMFAPTRLDVTADGSTRVWTYVGAGGLTAVIPPAGPSWAFDYVNVNGAVLSYVRTPGGAEIRYEYVRYLFDRHIGSESDPNRLRHLESAVVRRRIVSGNAPAGVWTYEYEYEQGSRTNTARVAHPDGLTRTAFVYGPTGQSLMRLPESDNYNSFAVDGYGLRERRLETRPDPGSPWAVKERETRSYRVVPVTAQRDGTTELTVVEVARDGLEPVRVVVCRRHCQLTTGRQSIGDAFC